mmetsp:Transcript_58115/g.95428  ORF Transcript_58115/g.95428 Transcript_58115/m.95428 type:complete len:87 (+) Transcript_58115:31-291(+)
MHCGRSSENRALEDWVVGMRGLQSLRAWGFQPSPQDISQCVRSADNPTASGCVSISHPPALCTRGHSRHPQPSTYYITRGKGGGGK